jgi:CheY-like chemotaxis protein
VLAKLLSENLDGNLTVKQVEFARTIHEAGADLLQPINDILDLSKVEAGKMEAHPAAIALDALLDYVDATFRPTAAQKGLTFEIEVNPDVPALIYSDEQRLQQILRNLLSTFTLYLPGRQVAGAAGAASPMSRPGSGVSRTVPADSVTALASAGRAASAVAGLDDGSCQENDPLSGAKILIVDDDVRNVFALTSVFEWYGAQIRYAENGRQGMEILDREDDIALVLMDVMMPELDGYATTAAIRRRPEFAELPIITVTAKAMKGDRAKSIASGASEYVTKPVDISHLIGLMRGWLEQRPRQAGLPPTHPRTEGSG